MALSGIGFVGVIVAGSYVVTAEPARKFVITKVLGSAFVVSTEKGLILTCDHVLPKVDRDSNLDFAFYTLDAAMKFQVHLIDKQFCEQWESNDLILLRLRDQSSLVSYDLLTEELSLGEQVIAVGMPLDHHKSTSTRSHFVVRGFTGFVVTGYEIEYEMDSQVIVTMSGCPVMHGQFIAGVAHTNRQYGKELLTEETIEVVNESGARKTEHYTYNEVVKLGVFYKATAFSGWLNGMVEDAVKYV
jgi:hypothetical protein